MAQGHLLKLGGRRALKLVPDSDMSDARRPLPREMAHPCPKGWWDLWEVKASSTGLRPLCSGRGEKTTIKGSP